MSAQVTSAETIAQDKAHVWHHLVQHKPFDEGEPMIITDGKGMRVTDIHGREYLDAVSGGVWTVNVGYGRERIANAVRDQLMRMNYIAGAYGNLPAAAFADKLIDKMPGLSRVYYSSSGSEANEKAFKIVRQISQRKHNGQKSKILYRDRDYHGTTITALSASGQPQRSAQYGPFTPGFVAVPHCCEYRSQFGDVDDYGVRVARETETILQQEDPDTVGAIILEPITAGGGVIPPPAGYWETMQEICTRYGLLLIIDEVVCGLGRTGTWFGYQHFGVKPDIVTMAKGVASGYAAISCTVTTEAVFAQFKDDASDPLSYFRDISTFGGCTAGPAAALENMAIIEEENLLQNVADNGEYFLARLAELKEKHAIVGDVRGMGFFAGVELVTDRASKTPLPEASVGTVVADCLKQGVMIGRTNRSLEGYNNTLTLSPALIATQQDLDEIVGAIDQALRRVG